MFSHKSRIRHILFSPVHTVASENPAFFLLKLDLYVWNATVTSQLYYKYLVANYREVPVLFVTSQTVVYLNCTSCDAPSEKWSQQKK